MDLDLSPEHALLRDTIRDFMLTEVAPVIDEHERERRFPIRDRPADRRARLAGHPDPRGRGRRRARHAGLRHRDRGDRPGLGLARADRRGAHEPRLRSAPPGRLARAAAALARADGAGRGHRRVRPDRAGRRERFGRDADDRAAARTGRTAGTWVIDGGKRFITNAGQAGTYIVTARTGTRDDGAAEISAFIVPADTPGFSRRAARGQARVCTPRRPASSRFDGARVPAANMLGEQGSGFKTFLRILDGGRISIGALAVGHRPGRARRVDPVRPDARAVRPADRHVPGRRVHGRRHGDRDRGGARASSGGRPGSRTRAATSGSSPRRPSCSPRRSARGSRTTRSRSTAATATSPTIRSSATCAMPS